MSLSRLRSYLLHLFGVSFSFPEEAMRSGLALTYHFFMASQVLRIQENMLVFGRNREVEQSLVVFTSITFNKEMIIYWQSKPVWNS